MSTTAEHALAGGLAWTSSGNLESGAGSGTSYVSARAQLPVKVEKGGARAPKDVEMEVGVLLGFPLKRTLLPTGEQYQVGRAVASGRGLSRAWISIHPMNIHACYGDPSITGVSICLPEACTACGEFENSNETKCISFPLSPRAGNVFQSQ